MTAIMKAVIQRVSRAKVLLGESTVGSIDNGLCILIGIHISDTIEDAAKLLSKVISLRLFSDNWDASLSSNRNLSLLLISQFTLQARCDRGNKPDFHHAMPGEKAKILFDQMVQMACERLGKERVQTGEFGKKTSVMIENDGPTTIILDTRQ